MKKVAKKEATLESLQGNIRDVLKAVDGLAVSMHGLHERMDGMDDRLDSMEKKMTKLVTTEHHDERIADLRGELVQLVRKEDRKLRYQRTQIANCKAES